MPRIVYTYQGKPQKISLSGEFSSKQQTMQKQTLRIGMLTWLLAFLGCGSQESGISDIPELDDTADRELFFPILRNYDPDVFFAQTIVHRPVTDDLAVFAFRRIPRPNGRIGVDYVMKESLEFYDLSEDDILGLAFDNLLASEIKVNVAEQDGSKLFEVVSDKGFAAAMIGHASTYSRFSQMADCDTLVVSIVSPDVVHFTAVGSSFEQELIQDDQSNEDFSDPVDLTPGLYCWQSDGSLVTMAEREQHQP